MSNKDEKLVFDKFMTDIVGREDKARSNHDRHENEPAESPQRRIERLYRERWQNRIQWPKWGKK